MAQQSILDARLAEIDRRLRTIQSGLTPGESAAAAPVPEPAAVPAPAEPPAAASPTQPPARAAEDQLAELGELIADLRQAAAAHERLLASTRELLSAFADALAHAPQPEPVSVRPLRAVVPEPAPIPGSAPAPSASASASASVSVAAGPFVDTGALRRFERALAALPEVRDVTVREFTGEDRAVVDVHLAS